MEEQRSAATEANNPFQQAELRRFLSVELPVVSARLKSLFFVSVSQLWLLVTSSFLVSYIVYVDPMNSVWDIFSSVRLYFCAIVLPIFFVLFVVGVTAAYTLSRLPDFLGTQESAIIIVSLQTTLFLVNLTSIYHLVVSDEAGIVKVLCLASIASILAIGISISLLLDGCRRIGRHLFHSSSQVAVSKSFKLTGLFFAAFLLFAANIYMFSTFFVFPVSALLICFGLVYVGFLFTRSMMALSTEVTLLLNEVVNAPTNESKRAKN